MTSVEDKLAGPPRFRGDWIGPDDHGYEVLRRLQDRRTDRRPAVLAPWGW